MKSPATYAGDPRHHVSDLERMKAGADECIINLETERDMLASEVERLNGLLRDAGFVLAMWSPCCEFLRRGDHWTEGAMHDGRCRSRRGGTLGPTIRLVAHPEDRAK